MTAGMSAGMSAAPGVGAGAETGAVSDAGMGAVAGVGTEPATGAEPDLGMSEDPRELVRGDVASVRAAVGHLADLAAGFGTTADGLRAVEVGSWTGAAADAFRARFAAAPAQWSRAAEAFRSAARAWDRFGAALAGAQAQAEAAVARFRAATAASARSYSAYSAQVDYYLLRLALGQHPNPVPVLDDAGAAEVHAARQMLADARARRDVAGDAATRAVLAAAAASPDPPTGWDLPGAELSDWLGASGIELAHAAQGLGEGVEGLVRFARMLNPADSYYLSHPARLVENASEGLAGAVDTVAHPLRLVTSLVGTGWSSDPARAFGHLAPTIVAAAVGGRSGLGGSGDAAQGAAGQAGAAGRAVGDGAREGRGTPGGAVLGGPGAAGRAAADAARPGAGAAVPAARSGLGSPRPAGEVGGTARPALGSTGDPARSAAHRAGEAARPGRPLLTDPRPTARPFEPTAPPADPVTSPNPPIGPPHAPAGPPGAVGPAHSPANPPGPTVPQSAPAGSQSPVGPQSAPAGSQSPVGPQSAPAGSQSPVGPQHPPVGPPGPVGSPPPAPGPMAPSVGGGAAIEADGAAAAQLGEIGRRLPSNLERLAPKDVAPTPPVPLPSHTSPPKTPPPKTPPPKTPAPTTPASRPRKPPDPPPGPAGPKGQRAPGAEAAKPPTRAGGPASRGGHHDPERARRSRLTRADRDFTSPLSSHGARKSHIDQRGDLVPANPDGATSMVDHVVGRRSPTKGDSPYSSFTGPSATAEVEFGGQTIEVDIVRLQADIDAGLVPGVEILPPHRVQAVIQADADRIAGRPVDLYVRKGHAAKAAQSYGLGAEATAALRQRMIDMANAQRHHEWMIRGVVPGRYIVGPHHGGPNG